MSFNITPYKSRAPPGQLGSTPSRSVHTNRFRSSLVPSSRPSPARLSHSPAKPPATEPATTAASSRDLFRTSSSRGQRATAFTPDLPAGVTRPRPNARKFAPRKSVSTGMSNTASTEPFQMRIPSPDPNLTGEILARQVPDDPTRTGSIYADEFLAKKCPQQFDELQRRQFFCILDLRRLKYAADEIFAKKDWKLNILNFAKEYEKSRSLIMLRYGLYEFKSVKPSNEVLKKWRAAHGLPSEPEEANGTSTQKARTPGPAGATKRKAAEELTPKTNPLMASTSNRNKRRNLAQEEAEDAVLNGPAPFKKSKRKADEGDEMDENKPSKQQKSTPSTATSLFASIINKPRDGGTSPSKPTSQSPSLFGLSKPKDSPSASFATKANPFQAADSSLLFGTPKLNNPSLSSGSVLADHKIGSAPATNTGNIFSYLSESSQNDDDDDHETDEEQEKDSEEQVPSGAISTNTSTPPLQNGSSLFGTSKPSSTANIFGALTKPADQVTKGGLFGRVQMGADGQPVRASPVPDEKQIDSANQTPATGTPAKKPGDYTFNPTTTPISFGTPALGTAKSTSKGEGEADKQSDTSEPKKPVSIFGVSGSVGPGPALSAPSLFGSSLTSAKPTSSETPVSIFSSQKPVSATNIFGTPSTVAAPSSFGNQTSEAAPTTEKPAAALFDKSTNSATAISDSTAPASKDDDRTTSNTATEGKAPSIFDQSFIAKNAAQAKPLSDSSKPSPDLFSRGSNPLFGGTKTSKPDSSAPVVEDQVKDKVKNETKAPAPAPSIFDKSFIANNAAQVKKTPDVAQLSPGLFSRGSNPLFGTPTAAKTNGTASADTKSIFGQTKKISPPLTASEPKALQTPQNAQKDATPSTPSIFGLQGSSQPSAPTSTLFGQQKPEEPVKPTSIFGSTPAAPTAGSIFSFGSQPKVNAASQSPLSFSAGPVSAPAVSFGAGSNPSPAVSFDFGATNPQANGGAAKKVGFEFGGSGSTGGSSSFAFGQDSSAGSSFTFNAGADKKVNNPFATAQPGSQPSAPMFGSNSSTTTPASSFNFTFGQQASTPQAAPPAQNGNLFGGSSSTNGAPGFSFTQASPSQNSSDIKFSKSSAVNPFGPLGSQGSTIANSSFPAPSSMGTTPVNGTPEPQSPHPDGEEAPQEQIKLTDGGPGEEDEEILHEVRAKAIKYIVVQEDDEDDKDKKSKSPWSTMGVGPLRVLKNKSTGAVRVLLRGEPRGHVAINKTILSDMKYEATDKTVKLVAASDDGSSLETWLLQVKLPSFAAELAAVMEANKSANKK